MNIKQAEGLLSKTDKETLRVSKDIVEAISNAMVEYDLPLHNKLMREKVVERVAEKLTPLTDSIALLGGIKEMCGYVENGSNESVTISQDDATKHWCCSVGRDNIVGTGPTFSFAVVDAYTKFLKEEEQ